MFHLGTVRPLDGSTIALMDSTTPQRDQNELDRLNREYPGWRVWRSRNGDVLSGWVATNLNPHSTFDPTLHGDTAEQLERLLKCPPHRIGRPLREGEVAL
ncbi:hypothetical protein NOSIN_08730 [Nocardiopsis sinuspersici]|uniref:Uncharacterized protein n=2 Tax=Nocardiopsidaceae TaxID=83676 RepID=A0A1V3BZJ3_9ACTN|nr:hypothetical protein NOSIN_08730 [Nocardiopsis sinuspersici]